jgi:Raf kinase inhibitor-like YbhB/YbcL family protein
MALSVTSNSFGNGRRIPATYAVGVPTPDGHATIGGGNRNPHLQWSGAPQETQSYALILVDPDVPSDLSTLNVEGQSIAEDAPRQDFAHWLVVDIPTSVTEIAEGADSDGFTPQGTPAGRTRYGGVTGANGYTGFFAQDPQLGGTYGGYDGPFPPWNDERVHHYHFRVVALDVPSLGLSGAFGLDDVKRAMQGHVLDEGEWVGTYSTNPKLARQG